MSPKVPIEVLNVHVRIIAGSKNIYLTFDAYFKNSSFISIAWIFAKISDNFD